LIIGTDARSQRQQREQRFLGEMQKREQIFKQERLEEAH